MSHFSFSRIGLVAAVVAIFAGVADGQTLPRAIADEPLPRAWIVDPLGRIAKNAEPHSSEVAFTVSDLPSGTYFLSVETMDGSEQRKQIVILR